MTYRGQVQNGMVVLPEGVTLPEGAEVEVGVIPIQAAPPHGTTDAPSLYDRMRRVVGVAKGLPADLARNHDYYLHIARRLRS
jgi:hypothetical protein